MPRPAPTAVLCPRGCVLFPGDLARVEVSDPANLAALDSLASADDVIAIVPPRIWNRLPGPRNLENIGTAARVRSRLKLPHGGERVTLQGLYRVHVTEVVLDESTLRATVQRVRTATAPSEHQTPLLAEIRDLVQTMAVRGSRRLATGCDPVDLPALLELNAPDADQIVDFAAPLFDLEPHERSALLVPVDPIERLKALIVVLRAEVISTEQAHGIEAKVRERVRRNYLREQLEAIRQELGDEDPRDAEIRELTERLELAQLPETVREITEREIPNLARCPRGSNEWVQLRNWLEWILELPWNEASSLPEIDPSAFEMVRGALDESHTALDDVKERVIEFLAVRQLRHSAHGAALCFLGPPGTGKSSMGRAVARALGRRFVHIQVGGITEQEELRGGSHRHDGGAPGVVLEGIRRAGTCDPVILLDEIDKLELGGSGTAGGALLEILDPAHNEEFVDEYLGVPFDLSRCIFLATANDLSEVSEAVVDRLEIIEFYGYTEAEKLAIAREHLLAAVRVSAGLEAHQFRLSPAALRSVVRNYTEEAGVRQLYRVLYALARKTAVDVVRGGEGFLVCKGDLLELIGPSVAEEDMQMRRPAIGVSAGLAWTSVGGALLPVEALAMPGSGRTQLTGQVGEVMRESVQTAISYVRTLFGELGLKADTLESLDVHIHFPSGAVPKDGPSAGVAIALAILSILTRTPVRHDVAMTGEVSLRGQILPVGGMREKLLAALRAGIHEVVVPGRNEEDVVRLPAEIRSAVTIHLVDHIQDVFALALSQRRGRGRGATLRNLGRRKRAARRAEGGA